MVGFWMVVAPARARSPARAEKIGHGLVGLRWSVLRFLSGFTRTGHGGVGGSAVELCRY